MKEGLGNAVLTFPACVEEGSLESVKGASLLPARGRKRAGELLFYTVVMKNVPFRNCM